MLKGHYGVSQYLTSNIPRDIDEGSIKKSESKYEWDTSIVRASIIEK